MSATRFTILGHSELFGRIFVAIDFDILHFNLASATSKEETRKRKMKFVSHVPIGPMHGFFISILVLKKGPNSTQRLLNNVAMNTRKQTEQTAN